MRSSLICFVTLVLIFPAGSTFAQFDFGNFIEGRAQQAIQRFDNRLRREIRGGIQKVLPYVPPVTQPPVTTLPYPIETVPPVHQIQPYPGTIVHPPYQGEIIHQPTRPPESLAGTTDGTRKPTENKSETKTVKLPKVESGGLVNVSGRTYGKQQGTVYVKIESLVLRARTLKWTTERIQARLPYLPMLQPVQATVIVVGRDEKIADKAVIELTPAPRLAANKAATKPQIPTVYAGQKLTLNGKMGQNAGTVQLQVGKTTMIANIIKWTESKVHFELPPIALAGVQSAEIIISGSDGKMIDTLPVKFAPAKQKK